MRLQTSSAAALSSAILRIGRIAIMAVAQRRAPQQAIIAASAVPGFAVFQACRVEFTLTHPLSATLSKIPQGDWRPPAAGTWQWIGCHLSAWPPPAKRPAQTEW